MQESRPATDYLISGVELHQSRGARTGTRLASAWRGGGGGALLYAGLCQDTQLSSCCGGVRV